MRTRALATLLSVLMLVMAVDAGARMTDTGGAAAPSAGDVKPGRGPRSADPAKPEKRDQAVSSPAPLSDGAAAEPVASPPLPTDPVVVNAPPADSTIDSTIDPTVAATTAAPAVAPAAVSAATTPAPPPIPAVIRRAKAHPARDEVSAEATAEPPVTRDTAAPNSSSTSSLHGLGTDPVAAVAGGRRGPVIELSAGGRQAVRLIRDRVAASPAPTPLGLVDNRELPAAPGHALRRHLMAGSLALLAIGELLLVWLLVSRRRLRPVAEPVAADS